MQINPIETPALYTIIMSDSIVKTCKFHGDLTESDCYRTNVDTHKSKTKSRLRCKRCSVKRAMDWQSRNKDKTLSRYKKKRFDDKLNVLQHYSNCNTPFCSCCKESNLEFLALDHIDGSGNQHRITVGKHMYAWAIKNNYPDIFRVLCHNCNMSYGLYGYCPHNKNDANPLAT